MIFYLNLVLGLGYLHQFYYLTLVTMKIDDDYLDQLPMMLK